MSVKAPQYILRTANNELYHKTKLYGKVHYLQIIKRSIDVLRQQGGLPKWISNFLIKNYSGK